jgi:hypothetical protein
VRGARRKKLIQGLSLLLTQPRLVEQTCDLCRQWVFDSQNRRIKRHGALVARPAGAPTPCITCPKKNPSDGERFDRAVSYLARLLRRYHEIVGTGGACRTPLERADSILHRDLGLVHAALRRSDAAETARQLYLLFTKGSPQ